MSELDSKISEIECSLVEGYDNLINSLEERKSILRSTLENLRLKTTGEADEKIKVLNNIKNELEVVKVIEKNLSELLLSKPKSNINRGNRAESQKSKDKKDQRKLLLPAKTLDEWEDLSLSTMSTNSVSGNTTTSLFYFDIDPNESSKFGQHYRKRAMEAYVTAQNETKKLLQPNFTIGTWGYNDSEFQSGRGIAIDENSLNIFVADYGNHRVQVFNKKGQFIQHIGTKELKGPIGISLSSENIYVTDKKKSKILRFNLSTGNYELKNEDNISILNNPTGIAFDSTKEDVYVANTNDNSVTKFCKDLIIKDKKFGDMDFNTPCDIKITSENIAILDWSRPYCLHILKKTGKLVKSIIGHREQVEYCHYPHYFCIDAENNYIISDTHTDTVKKFSPEGSLIETLGRKGKAIGEFEVVHGVATVKATNMLYVVSDNEQYVIQCFDMTP